MPLHHYIEQYFQKYPEARSKGIIVEDPPLEKRPKVLNVEDIFVHAGTHQIPIRIYTPEEESPYPLYVFFHGGGFVNGSLESHDVSCRLTSSLSGVKVIAVDYRMAPKYPTVAAFQDCYAVTKWVVENAKKLGGNLDQIAIGGASAGGYIASCVAIKSIITGDFNLSQQVLYYPTTDLDEKIKGSEYQSRELYNAKYGVDITLNQGYLNHQEFIPFQSIIKTDLNILAKMPKTLIFTAEYDPLCDEGEIFAEKLKEAGVNVRLVRFDGDIHGFMQYFPGSPDYMRGYDITSEFLIEED